MCNMCTAPKSPMNPSCVDMSFGVYIQSVYIAFAETMMIVSKTGFDFIKMFRAVTLKG